VAASCSAVRQCGPRDQMQSIVDLDTGCSDGAGSAPPCWLHLRENLAG
jgi:hypothetical protein